jgi:hypothetical protein
LFEINFDIINSLIFLAKFQPHFQKCLYLILSFQDKDLLTVENQKALIENIINQLTCSCTKDKDSLSYICGARYCTLVDSNYLNLFESILTERNLYLKYFAYSKFNFKHLLIFLYDKYKSITDKEQIQVKCGENTSFITYFELDQNKKVSFKNSKKEIKLYNKTSTKFDYFLDLNCDLASQKKLPLLLRELCHLITLLVKNMIVDIGLSDGETVYEEKNPLLEKEQDKEAEKMEIYVDLKKYEKLKDYNNILDLYTCLTLNKDKNNDVLKNSNTNNINSSDTVLIPKPYDKPREFIINQDDFGNKYDYNNDKDNYDDYNIEKEIYSNKPIYYITDEPYEVIKNILSLVIEKFNDSDPVTNDKFGLNNILELELLILIIELFCDLNYTIHVNKLIKDHKKSIQCEKLKNNPTNDRNNLINTETIMNTTNLKHIKTLNKDKRILQYVKSNDFKWELKSIFTNAEERVDCLISDKNSLTNFFKKLVECFIKFENNSILHKNFEYLVNFLFLDFCPRQFSNTFIEESNILNTIVNSNSSFAFTKRHLANICEISALVFTTSNLKIQKEIDSSKLYSYNFITIIILYLYYFPLNTNTID